MAGLNTGVEVKAPGPRQSYDGPLGGFGWAMSWLDYVAYSIERGVVVVAMLTMVTVEFVYILYENVNTQRLVLQNWSSGTQGAGFPIGLLLLVAFIGLLMAAIVQNTALGKLSDGSPRPAGHRAAATLVLLGGVIGLSALSILVGLERSWVFYVVVVLLVGAGVVGDFWQRGKRQVAGWLVLGWAAALYAAANAPSGYSWADDYALFLLMWMGFLGGSMATRQRMHIRLDVARKFCPRGGLHIFNAVSDLIAASFTGVLVYLSYLYLFKPGIGRYYAYTAPGELPDWLLVGAIPMSLLLIMTRFAGRAVVEIAMGPKPPEGEEGEGGEGVESGDDVAGDAASEGGDDAEGSKEVAS